MGRVTVTGTERGFSMKLSKRKSLVDAGITMDNFDRILNLIAYSTGQLKALNESPVKAQKAERDLAPLVDDARDFLDYVLKRKDDREILVRLFGRDCRQLVHLEALLASIEYKVEKDERRQQCLAKADAVMKVLIQRGYRGVIEAALMMEKDASSEDLDAAGGEEDVGATQALEHIAQAIVAGSEGVLREEEGDVPQALEQFSLASKSIKRAVLVWRAVGKFKALAHLDREHVEEDLEHLEAHCEEIGRRMAYLSSLGPDEWPSVPLQEHISTRELKTTQKDPTWRTRIVQWCGTFGATAGGTMLLGPFGGLVLGTAALTLFNKRDPVEEEEECSEGSTCSD